MSLPSLSKLSVEELLWIGSKACLDFCDFYAVKAGTMRDTEPKMADRSAKARVKKCYLRLTEPSLVFRPDGGNNPVSNSIRLLLPSCIL